jgi:hypothetical protein
MKEPMTMIDSSKCFVLVPMAVAIYVWAQYDVNEVRVRSFRVLRASLGMEFLNSIKSVKNCKDQDELYLVTHISDHERKDEVMPYHAELLSCCLCAWFIRYSYQVDTEVAGS